MLCLAACLAFAASAGGGCGDDEEHEARIDAPANTTRSDSTTPAAKARPALERRLTEVASLSGVGVAIGGLSGGPIRSAGELTKMRAWSTMKVPVIVATIQARRAGKLPGTRELTAAERDAIEAAITRSDNAAALALWDELVSAFGDNAAAARRTDMVLHQAGDQATTVASAPDPRGFSPFGRTVWTLKGAATFYRSLALGDLLSDDDTALILDAMGRVVPDQRWGVGATSWEGAPPLRFKGGWGPSESDTGGYEVLQIGLIGEGEKGLVVSIAGTGPDYAAAAAVASRAAQALARSG